MTQKKLPNTKHVLAAWRMQNDIAGGMAIGAKPAGDVFAQAVVMLLGNGKDVQLVINKDKLEELGATVCFKNYEDPLPEFGIAGT